MADTSSEKIPQKLTDAYIEDPRFLCEHIINDEIFGGSVTLPLIADPENFDSEKNSIVTIPFILKSDFGFSLGNKWDSIIPQDIGNMLSKLQTYGSMMDGDIIQGQLTSRAMSVATWQGSETPNFSINIAFVSTRRSYNPVTIIEALAATCLPLKIPQDSNEAQTQKKLRDGAANLVDTAAQKVETIQDQVSNNKALSGFLNFAQHLLSGAAGAMRHMGVYAPLAYKPTLDVDTDTVSVAQERSVSLKIGNWFRARNLVVQSISNINFSRQTIAPKPDWSYDPTRMGNNSSPNLYSGVQTNPEKEQHWGFPVFAECTVTFRPITMITYDEFLEYFTQPVYDKVVRAKMQQVQKNTAINSHFKKVNAKLISMDGGIG